MPIRFIAICCFVAKRYVIQQMFLNEWIESAMLGTRWYNFQPRYTNPEGHNAQHYRQTGVMMPIVNILLVWIQPFFWSFSSVSCTVCMNYECLECFVDCNGSLVTGNNFFEYLFIMNMCWCCFAAAYMLFIISTACFCCSITGHRLCLSELAEFQAELGRRADNACIGNVVTFLSSFSSFFYSSSSSFFFWVIVREHSFPRNARFWAEPQNLLVSTEFCRIWYWLVIRGQIRHILVRFRQP